MNSILTTDEILGPGLAQIKRDLIACFQRFPIESLLHLRNNFDRLIRGAYKKSGGGCIFHLLSEALPERIERRQDLIRYFTGKSADDCDEPVYRPAKHIVKIWDGDLSHSHTSVRYPGVKRLEKRFLMAVLLEAIELRQSAAAKIERRALEKTGHRTLESRAARKSAVLAFLGL